MERELHRVRTSLLEMSYEALGPASGYPVVLLHGWPDDVHTWNEVGTRLADAGFRVIMPYLRGFGPTRFLSDDSMRSGQISALASDVMEMTEALGLEQYALVGHDWGARAAYVMAGEDASRISHLVAISVGYGTSAADQQLPIHQIRNYWYQWYFALPRGEALVRQSGRALCRFMWESWSPTWQHSEDEFEETAAAFDNPDWPDVTIHSYRHRWGHASGDPRYDALERRIADMPKVRVPTLVLHGQKDACTDPATSAGKEAHFSAQYRRIVLPEIGHFPQREAPETVAESILSWLAGRGRPG